MGLLYFFETTMDLQGEKWEDHVRMCLCTCRAFTESTLGRNGGIKQIWKIPGEHKLIGVLTVESPEELDSFTSFSIKNCFGGKISSEFTPLRPYEDFAATVKERLQQWSVNTPVPSVPKAGLHYLLKFTVEYEGQYLKPFKGVVNGEFFGMTQEDLFKIWLEEATAALGAKKKGIVLDLWKVVAQRKVFAIICVDDPGALDEISFDLPIMKKMGDKVHITCKSICHMTKWIYELEQIAQLK